ncbi:HAMP domain-containing protein [Ideonella sp. TBM-1]|uniref:histidine kinase n=2 Tax=Ideonella livida TaxID=2707176 RepID=A0A7C9THK1_9BURK|nr:HAMP domain-containing protein [Ideonella livida]
MLVSGLMVAAVLAWSLLLDHRQELVLGAHAGRQMAGVVSVTVLGVQQSEGQRRNALLQQAASKEGLQLLRREPGDNWRTLETDTFHSAFSQAVRERLGPGTLLARSVNDAEGVWVGFELDGNLYWLKADAARWQPGSTLPDWWWMALLAMLCFVITAIFVRLINGPLKQLSFAASRLSEGEFDSNLDESNITAEVRMVNKGFNRMARELAKVEEERAVMLAGISHDLRTPLARLRLEAEISVSDEEARRNMANDIDQLDAIIDKFMDYARPEGTRIVPVNITQVVEREASLFRDKNQIRIHPRLPPNLMVQGDDTELGRVFSNLFENARRYGRSIDTGVARVKVSHVQTGDAIIITVRDYGQGVAPEKLAHLTTPFFRGDAARTAATGAGLGLAVVKKALQRIGGALELNNATEKTGLVAHIRLKKA